MEKGYRILEFMMFMNTKSNNTTRNAYRRPVCRLYRHVSEIESLGERLARMCSKPGRIRAIYRIVLEELGDTARQIFNQG